MRSLSQSELNSFKDEGYIIVRQCVETSSYFDILESFLYKSIAVAQREGLSTICPNTPERLDLREKANTLDCLLLELLKKDKDLVGEIYDHISLCMPMLRLVGNTTISRFAAQLLGHKNDNSLYGFANRIRIDPPLDNRRTYGWHQETFYTIPKADFVQSWAPLFRPSSHENGTISILPKSHKEGIPFQTWNESDTRSLQILINEDTISRYEPLEINIEPGDLLLFDGKLAHKSGNNTSKHIRYSLVGMYIDSTSSAIRTPSISHNYRGINPKEYFNQLFGH